MTCPNPNIGRRDSNRLGLEASQPAKLATGLGVPLGNEIHGTRELREWGKPTP